MVRYKILGLDDFDKKEIDLVNDIVAVHCNKFSRKFTNSVFVIQAKKYEKDGRGHHYSFHVKMENPSVIVGVKENDWDLKKCIHSVFDKLAFKLQHRYHLEGHDERHRI